MNENIDLMQILPILAPIAVIQLILMIVALAMCFKAEYTRGPKWMWALIIIFVNFFGPVAFFIFGRKNDG